MPIFSSYKMNISFRNVFKRFPFSSFSTQLTWPCVLPSHFLTFYLRLIPQFCGRRRVAVFSTSAARYLGVPAERQNVVFFGPLLALSVALRNHSARPAHLRRLDRLLIYSLAL